MKLTVFERIILMNILPREGDFRTLKILREFRESLSFSEKENKRLAFKREGPKVLWKQSAARLKEVKVSDVIKDIIVETFKRLNEQKRLKEEHLDLYEKFVETK